MLTKAYKAGVLNNLSPCHWAVYIIQKQSFVIWNTYLETIPLKLNPSIFGALRFMSAWNDSNSDVALSPAIATAAKRLLFSMMFLISVASKLSVITCHTSEVWITWQINNSNSYGISCNWQFSLIRHYCVQMMQETTDAAIDRIRQNLLSATDITHKF